MSAANRKIWGPLHEPPSANCIRQPHSWYAGRMTKDRVKQLLDRVLTWPAERQEDVAHVLELMEEQHGSDLRLTDEQLTEVRRRRAERDPKTMTLAEFNERLRRRYGI